METALKAYEEASIVAQFATHQDLSPKLDSIYKQTNHEKMAFLGSSLGKINEYVYKADTYCVGECMNYIF